MEKIQPEQIVKILHEKGIEVTVEEAKLILDFMRKLADITVTQYLNQ
jgi:hypothetical protein